jgi:hypothetical protein
MEMIRSFLWLGSQNTRKYSSHYIKNVGVTCIVNVARGLVCPTIDGIQEFRFNLLDGYMDGFNATKFNEEVMKIATIIEGLKTQEHTLMVHCHAGQSRAPHVIATYLAVYEGGNYEDYWNEIRSYRTCIHEKSFRMRYKN